MGDIIKIGDHAAAAWCGVGSRTERQEKVGRGSRREAALSFSLAGIGQDASWSEEQLWICKTSVPIIKGYHTPEAIFNDQFRTYSIHSGKHQVGKGWHWKYGVEGCPNTYRVVLELDSRG